MNYFNTTNHQIHRADNEDLPQILTKIKEGMELANTRMKNLLQYVSKKKDYLIVETPVQWAQSLHQVFIELSYAHRHGAPGCSNQHDEDIEIAEDYISLSVMCQEVNTKVKYSIKIQLWDKIDVNKSSHEYQAVGRQHFTLTKLKAPARWRTLYSEEVNPSELNTAEPINPLLPKKEGWKPYQIRLWYTKHERFVQNLWEFDGDSIDDFEGYKWMDDKSEEYDEYYHRKGLSKKGPIPLKKKKKSKKVKK
eukprot:403354186